MVGFGLRRRNVADRAEQSADVVPVDPVHRGDLDCSRAAPGALTMDNLCLQQADHGPGWRIVVAVADGGLDTRFGQALGVLDRHVLHAIEGQQAFDPIRVPRMVDSSEVRASTQPDGGKGSAKHEGVVARRGLQAVWRKPASGWTRTGYEAVQGAGERADGHQRFSGKVGL